VVITGRRMQSSGMLMGRMGGRLEGGARPPGAPAGRMNA
jgi:hypothetical protein